MLLTVWPKCEVTLQPEVLHLSDLNGGYFFLVNYAIVSIELFGGVITVVWHVACLHMLGIWRKSDAVKKCKQTFFRGAGFILSVLFAYCLYVSHEDWQKFCSAAFMTELDWVVAILQDGSNSACQVAFFTHKTLSQDKHATPRERVCYGWGCCPCQKKTQSHLKMSLIPA